MLARDAYRASLCKCGQPKDKAWNDDNDGWYTVTATFECHACTALLRESDPSAEPVQFHAVTDTRDYEANPLPPMPTGPRLSPEELADAMGGAEL